MKNVAMSLNSVYWLQKVLGSCSSGGSVSLPKGLVGQVCFISKNTENILEISVKLFKPGNRDQYITPAVITKPGFI